MADSNDSYGTFYSIVYFIRCNILYNYFASEIASNDSHEFPCLQITVILSIAGNK